MEWFRHITRGLALTYRYRVNDVLVLPQELQDFAWSAPMRDLASEIGLSDVGLKKLLNARGVVTPPQGYWNKLRAGKKVPRCPKVSPRRPGETGRLRVDARLAGVLNPVEPLPSGGPFATKVLPEDLDLLAAQELKAIGRVTVPRTLDRAHYGLSQVLKREQRRREKFAASGWSWDAPNFDTAVGRRRLRILNALFLALSRRGHSGDAYEHDGEITATATIGDTSVRLSVDLAAVPRTHRASDAAGAARDNALAFTIHAGSDEGGDRIWRDEDGSSLESRLAEITAAIIVSGEANFRTGLKRAEEQAEQWRRWEERRRLEELAARNARRLDALRESGALLRQAEDLRALITSVAAAVAAGSVAIDEAVLADWRQWAAAEADRLDPILSGQVMAHLAQPPSA